MCAGSERDILVPQRGHLGQSQSGLHGGNQKGMVTASQPLRSIRRPQQRLDLWPGQKAHECASLPLVRNRQHSLDDFALRRRFQCGVTEERPNGRQTQVSALGSIAPAVFQIFQKRADQRGIQFMQRQLRGSLA
jgi:hypothetical protein